jgi:hypothetical protein
MTEILGPVEFVGIMPARKDLEVIPQSAEEKAAEIRAYKEFMDRYNNDPEFKTKIDAECAQWDKDYREYKEEEQRHRENCWALGVPTHPLPLGLGFRKHPMPHNPEGNIFAGWLK